MLTGADLTRAKGSVIVVLIAALLVVALGVLPGPVFEYLQRPVGSIPGGAVSRLIETDRPIADGR